MAGSRRRGPGTPRNTVRIIAGEWRSRRLEFPGHAALRPTPDRVRETVFNWLTPHLAGARCLDLFAGSGAFGFEALSRGATRAVLVERDAAVAAALRANGARLGAAGAEIIEADALDYLAGTPEMFDIVFLDPPYASGLLAPCLARLATAGWLGPGALVYIEARQGELPELPAGGQLARSKTAGQVGYHLARIRHDEESS